MDPKATLESLRAAIPEMLADLERVVAVDSPSADPAGCRRCAAELASIGQRRLGAAPQLLEQDGRPHLLWRFGTATRVLLIGHFDTVWPSGTAARWPFRVEGDTATGPGIFDMKAGLIQLLYAVAQLPDREGVTIFFNSDEEVGSPSSEALYSPIARQAEAAIIAEPSLAGALKIARKGISMYTVRVTGSACHASEPARGANALAEMAHQVWAVLELGAPALGTTVTPTTAEAGTARNTVPAEASFTVDVRASTSEEQARVERGLRALRPRLAGTSIEIVPGPGRGPMEAASSEALFDYARRLHRRMALPELEGRSVSGGSDGNQIASLGVRVLDGMGAVGDGMHAEGEHIKISAMAERAALAAGVIAGVLSGDARL